MSDIKYLEDGSAVVVVEKLESGFLVEPVYEYDGENIQDSRNPIRVSRVFDKAPTLKYETAIIRLRDEIQALEQQRTTLSLNQRGSEAMAKEIDSKLKKHESLRCLLDYIDGKITHYVEDGWNGVCIVPFFEATCAGDDRKRDLKLLTLFGDSRGNLQYKLNRYKDGSGCDSVVRPAKSMEEATAIAQEMFLDKMASRVDIAIVQNADKLGIAIPDEYRQKAKEKIAESLRAMIAKYDQDKSQAQAALEKIQAT